MKKIPVIIAVFLLIVRFTVVADEGMWLLTMLNKLNLNEKGCKLSPEDIYSINHSSLKDAVVGLGADGMGMRFFCSGEIISDQGLVLTNHHCGYESIQEHSSTQNDYTRNGFWAMSKAEELTNPKMTVSILLRLEDVTDKIVSQLNAQMSESDRQKKIADLTKSIQDEATKGTDYNAAVRSFFDGNQFYLFIYETYKDVRLVGAPPDAIGNFGGDTDNWMWPRHTGDFSMFRIYTGPDGKPAPYSKDNIPLKPKFHFSISLEGVKEGDFTMVMGFPGTTDRYLTSYGIEESIQITNPSRVKIRAEKLDIMKKDMDASDAVRIQYASKYARISNYWKYFIGQTAGLKRLDVYDKKKEFENKLQNWINADNSRKQKYGDAIGMISGAYEERKVLSKTSAYFSEALGGPEIVMFPAQVFNKLYPLLNQKQVDEKAVNVASADLLKASEGYFKDYDQATDKKLLSAMFSMFATDVAKEYHPDVFAFIAKKYDNNFNEYADYVFKKSLFADKNKYAEFLKNPSLKKLQKDPAFIIYQSVINKSMEIRKETEAISARLAKGNRTFVAAMMEMQSDKTFYPNANSTERLTYGYVGSYNPRDAVHYDYFTTTKGILEKEDPTNEEFIVPAKLKDLIEKKDFGRYGKNGVLNTCFTTNNDITGGNSGSPVLNAKGQLIGAAFDGNWEAMSGDIAYEPALQKCINVDIRYILFIIDKYAGAKNLIEEMTLVE
ncbi:MAG: S46 family peptidase [Bacteroidia bacterium]|nr:S46 family peptidase [Bacteroidia bacterium]